MKSLIFFALLFAAPSFATEMTPILGNNLICNDGDSDAQVGVQLSVSESGNKAEVIATVLKCDAAERRFIPIGNDLSHTYKTVDQNGNLIAIERTLENLELVISTEDGQVVAIALARIEGSKAIFAVDQGDLRDGDVAFIRTREIVRVVATGEVIEDTAYSASFRIRNP